jgi:hypothetical protein
MNAVPDLTVLISPTSSDVGVKKVYVGPAAPGTDVPGPDRNIVRSADETGTLDSRAAMELKEALDIPFDSEGLDFASLADWSPFHGSFDDPVDELGEMDSLGTWNPWGRLDSPSLVRLPSTASPLLPPAFDPSGSWTESPFGPALQGPWHEWAAAHPLPPITAKAPPAPRAERPTIAPRPAILRIYKVRGNFTFPIFLFSPCAATRGWIFPF